MRKTRINYRKTTSKKGCEQSQDGGGIGWGDHFLLHKFMKRSFESWATSTKQLLNNGRGHQAPRKAVHSLQKEIGQNIKDKKKDKGVRDLGRESWKRSFRTVGSPLTGGFVGIFGISEGNISGRKKKQSPQNMCLKHNSQQRNNPDAPVCHQQLGRRGLHA